MIILGFAKNYLVDQGGKEAVCAAVFEEQQKICTRVAVFKTRGKASKWYKSDGKKYYLYGQYTTDGSNMTLAVVPNEKREKLENTCEKTLEPIKDYQYFSYPSKISIQNETTIEAIEFTYLDDFVVKEYRKG